MCKLFSYIQPSCSSCRNSVRNLIFINFNEPLNQMVIDEIYGKALELGSHEFRHGNFSKALKIYARGISLGDARNKKEGTYGTHKHYSSKYKTLLDCRSACFQRLDLFNRALTDSNLLISIDKYGIKGYLRKAKILCLTENERDALMALHHGSKIIHRGIQKYGKRLRVNKKLFGQLLGERSRLAEKLNYSIITDSKGNEHLQRMESKTDFVTVFPPELTSRVVFYLDQRDVLSALTVSHVWNQTFTSLSQILKFPKLAKPISRKQFAKFIQFCGNVFEKSCSNRRIDKLHVVPTMDDELSIFSQLSNSMIETLHLSLSLRVIDNRKLLKLLESDDNLGMLFGSINFLELQMPLIQDGQGINPILSYLSNSKVLMLQLSEDGHSSSISTEETMKIRLSKLKRLSLNMVHSVRTQRQSNSVLMNQLFGYIDVPSLVNLDLTECDISHSDLRKALNPNLKILKLQKIPQMTVTSITIILNDVGCNLEELSFMQDDLERIVPEHMDGQNMDLSIFRNLHVLQLEKTYLSAIGLMKILASTHGTLEKLSLISNGQLAFGYGPLNNRVITTFSIIPYHDFVTCCPNLKLLSLVQCCNLDDHSISALSKEMMDQEQPRNIQELDLSYNNLTPRALTFLFNRYSWLRLRTLKVNGIYLSDDEISFLTSNGFCARVECRPVA